MEPSPFELFALPPGGYAIAAIFGALWGSFFNVAIHRLAREDARLRMILSPGSACPRCGKAIRFYDNVPMLSWLLLRGRCRDCHAPIAVRYPLVELASALLALAVYQRFFIDIPDLPGLRVARFLAFFFFTGTLLVLSLIDLDTMLLPEAITLPAIPTFFVAAQLLHDRAPLDGLIGLLLGFGLLKGIQLGYAAITGRDGMGGGDPVLMALIGGFLGWQAIPFTLGIGSTVGTLVAVPLLLIQRRRAKANTSAPPVESDGEPEPSLRHVEVPFGPFLCAGATLYLFFWPALHGWLLGALDQP